MRRLLSMGVAVGLGVSGATAEARTLAERHSCNDCGDGTTRRYQTIHPVLSVTRYHDRAVYHHVTRLHYVVDVTRIQPIVLVKDVTRLHHVTIVHDGYAEQPQVSVPMPDGGPRPGFASGCGCVD